MSTLTYFLGANTPEGFYSRYDTMFGDRRIRQLMILKGGPGCGKSTLMRTVAAAAAERGCDTEQILCSSDPDSLDGLIVPQAGLALVDGTAPHVVEPPLCGLGAWYLDLGRFYNAEVLIRSRAQLREEKEKNAACYPLCYLALRAAKSAADGLHKIASAVLPPDLLQELQPKLLPKLLPTGARPGDVLHRFTNALTPQGLLSQPIPCAEPVVIRDSFALAVPLLSKLARVYAAAGYTVTCAYDPLAPNEPQAVSVPAADAAFVRASRLFPAEKDTPLYLDLDALIQQRLTPENAKRLEALAQVRDASVAEAVRYLVTAKRHHDALEAAYRPAVDFAGVSETAAAVVRTLDRLLNAQA